MFLIIFPLKIRKICPALWRNVVFTYSHNFYGCMVYVFIVFMPSMPSLLKRVVAFQLKRLIFVYFLYSWPLCNLLISKASSCHSFKRTPLIAGPQGINYYCSCYNCAVHISKAEFVFFLQRFFCTPQVCSPDCSATCKGF